MKPGLWLYYILMTLQRDAILSFTEKKLLASGMVDWFSNAITFYSPRLPILEKEKRWLLMKRMLFFDCAPITAVLQENTLIKTPFEAFIDETCC